MPPSSFFTTGRSDAKRRYAHRRHETDGLPEPRNAGQVRWRMGGRRPKQFDRRPSGDLSDLPSSNRPYRIRIRTRFDARQRQTDRVRPYVKSIGPAGRTGGEVCDEPVEAIVQFPRFQTRSRRGGSRLRQRFRERTSGNLARQSDRPLPVDPFARPWWHGIRVSGRTSPIEKAGRDQGVAIPMAQQRHSPQPLSTRDSRRRWPKSPVDRDRNRRGPTRRHPLLGHGIYRRLRP